MTFRSGETVTATSVTPCRVAPSPRARPRLALSISPRRVAAGRRVRFRLRLAGPRECIERAVVRFRSRRWLAGPDGKRALYARLPRAGVHRATVTAPGCRGATATVRALP